MSPALVTSFGPESHIGRGVQRVDDDAYVLAVEGIEFQANHLRREKYETFGELVVRCHVAGARTVADGILSRATFNFSSATARRERAKQLAEMGRIREVDWPRLLEELCVGVLTAQEAGPPGQLLGTLPRPSGDEVLDVDGLRLLRAHPTVLFGDGGAAKSYLALYLAGRLAQRGLTVGLFDWELAGEDHRDRLERLFGADMPDVWYLRCDQPLVFALPHLRRFARQRRLEFAFFDSVGFAAHDKPEAPDAALAYFRAVRQLDVGSVHIAHVSKAVEGSDHKPFGSVFWHNAARATYYLKRATEAVDGVTVGVFNRKANLGALQSPMGFRFAFDISRTTITRTDLANTDEFAEQLPLVHRMRHVLRGGAMTIASIADELGAKPNTVTQTVKRGKGKLFTIVLGSDGIQRIGLLAQEAS